MKVVIEIAPRFMIPLIDKQPRISATLCETLIAKWHREEQKEKQKKK